jgi:hypothetical protein
MTEEQWLAATDPQAMLAFLLESGKLSERKLRLFSCACCRRVWHLLTDRRSRRAVEVAERLADGQAKAFEAESAYVNANKAARGSDGAGAALLSFFANPAPTAAAAAVRNRPGIYHPSAAPLVAGVTPGEVQVQAALLRDIFGPLPFRPVIVPPRVLQWNSGIVVMLAEAAYQDRHLPKGTLDSNRLAVLADALEEAGCTEQDTLSHLRGPGPHVRGCWPVDLLLGKS